jgi:hypothetical protein
MRTKALRFTLNGVPAEHAVPVHRLLREFSAVSGGAVAPRMSSSSREEEPVRVSYPLEAPCRSSKMRIRSGLAR